VKRLPEIPKLLASICALTLASAPPALLAGEERATRLSEPVAVTDDYEFFGSTLPESESAISLGELIENSEDYLDREVMVATRIAKVCQKKGCFFVAQEGASMARITFRDYGFFIPTDSGGKHVTLLGTFSRKSVSKEQAEHFASDLGETAAASQAQFEYSIVASAIKLPRS
jgi:hypothetical protein